MSKRIQRDYVELIKIAKSKTSCYIEDPEYKSDNLKNISILLKGLDKSPYEGGLWRLEICLPSDYPFSPPSVKFKTSIYHPNIKKYVKNNTIKDGSICLDILSSSHWMPSYSLNNVIQSISLLLVRANPDDPLSSKIGAEYKLDYSKFLDSAKKHTELYSIKY